MALAEGSKLDRADAAPARLLRVRPQPRLGDPHRRGAGALRVVLRVLVARRAAPRPTSRAGRAAAPARRPAPQHQGPPPSAGRSRRARPRPNAPVSPPSARWLGVARP